MLEKRPSVMTVATLRFFLVSSFACAFVFHDIVKVFRLVDFFKILNLGAFHFKYSPINYYIVPLLMFIHT